MNASLQESIKEGLRIIVIAVIPVILMGVNVETGEIAINWSVIIVVGLVAGLRFVDKWLHETGKAEKGLTRF